MAFTEERLLDQLQKVDSYEFEQFVADLWELQHWDTYVTTEAGDGGVDVIAEQSTPFNKKQVIQAKRYEPPNPVSRPDIQQYASIRQEQTDVDTVVVLTTSRFTDDAKNVARKLNVKLIDGTRLYNLIDALDAFKLAQSYIDPQASQDGSSSPDIEIETTDTSSERTSTEEGSELTNEFDYDKSIKNFPTYLPNIIKLREHIANKLPKLQSDVDTAEVAFNEGRYFDAVKQYEEIAERQEGLRREIARYDAGLTYLDRRTAEHLPDTEIFVTQIEQIAEKVDKQYRQAFRIVERAQALDRLVDEIRKYVSRVEDTIDRGDQLRRSGNFEAADLKYEQANHTVEIAYEPLEIYQELVTVYDDAVLESHEGLPQDLSLSELETEISSRIDSTNEPLEIHSIAEEAAGSFSGTLLNENDGELFDQESVPHKASPVNLI